MAGQRELSFDEDRPTDYVARVLALMNSGDYTAARVLVHTLTETQQLNVRRTIAAKTGIYL